MTRYERRQSVGRMVLGNVVHVSHRRGNVRVAHERLNVAQRERLKGQRSEGVAQIVQRILGSFAASSAFVNDA
jgi:hypothetical protein